MVVYGYGDNDRLCKHVWALLLWQRNDATSAGCLIEWVVIDMKNNRIIEWNKMKNQKINSKYRLNVIILIWCNITPILIGIYYNIIIRKLSLISISLMVLCLD